jgi:hypothetical protein
MPYLESGGAYLQFSDRLRYWTWRTTEVPVENHTFQVRFGVESLDVGGPPWYCGGSDGRVPIMLAGCNGIGGSAIIS